MDDKYLLQLLRSDPNAGMEHLIDQYAGLVYAVVRRQLEGSGYRSLDVEECAADVFSEFYLGLGKYDPERSGIKTYLCVLAKNNAIDLLRKRDREKMQLSLNGEDTLQLPAEDASMESKLEEAELTNAVIAAIRDLGEPDRSILLRKFYLGESSKEISRGLGLSVANVDTRTHRALKKLRSMFGGMNV